MPSSHISALNQLDAPLRNAVSAIVEASSFSASFTPQQVDQLIQISQLSADQLALALLPLAASYALTPVSQFNVGAIAHGASGHWYLGANIEFTGQQIQQTVHAEQCAITHAWHRGEKRLRRVTVNYTPCGHCRQFMNELNSGDALEIALPDRETKTLANYLPDAFGPNDLGIHQPLLDHQPQPFVISGDTLQQAAIRAAALSYAPYSQSYSGVALLTHNRRIYHGYYAENAAYNPSLPPLQAALVMLHLADESLDTVNRVVVAEMADPKLSQALSVCAMLPQIRVESIQLVLNEK